MIVLLAALVLSPTLFAACSNLFVFFWMGFWDYELAQYHMQIPDQAFM